MIYLHRLNGQDITINAELVECIESHGVETVVSLTTGNRLVVKEPVAEVVQRILAYRQAVYSDRKPIALVEGPAADEFIAASPVEEEERTGGPSCH
ncbi:MAG: flagellar FlbD family protein [Elusimicrobiota bacterium]|jgi:flagellar protein FlbD